MKKIKSLILLFILFVGIALPFNTYADVYKTGELIPLNTNASVTTDLFQYDFVVGSSINDKGNSQITFSNIKNFSSDKVPVSINILLFDSEQKNIGFLTYCSEKDVSTEYAGYKLNGNGNTSFYINIVSRYFVDNKTAADVKYVAVLDENKYCHIGGYDKYAGLTIDEINNGGLNMSEDAQLIQSLGFLKNHLFMIISIILFVGLGILFIEGLIINTLHRKMYSHGSILAFLPITNMYLCVKLAFGSTFAIMYIIGLLLSGLLAKFVPLLSVLVGGLGGLSFIVVIVKLVTKNYGLFTGLEDTKIEKKAVAKKEVVKEKEAPAPVVPTVEEVIAENKEEALDLSYSNGATAFMSQSNESSVSTNESASALGDMFSGTSTSNDINTEVKDDSDFVDINPSNDSSNESNENNFINFNSNNTEQSTANNSSDGNKEGESELSKFFQ